MLSQLLFLFVLLLSGIFCQRFFSSPNQKCTGDEVTFTCLVTDNSTGAIGSTLWNVTTPAGDSSFCSVRHNLLLTVTCGPDNEFTSMLTEQNGDNYTTTLSVPVDFNETTVECLDTVTRRVGSEDICIVGNAPAPQILSANISELGMFDDDRCVVTVRWREPFISCDGSVSQYVLTVTPPTCDLESSEDCMLMDNAAVYFVPGNETQYDIAVNGTMSLDYDMTVRADTCDNSLTGDLSPVYSINLMAVPRTSEPFSYHYVFNIITRKIEAINVSWPRVDILNGGAETAYRIVIIPGSGSGPENEMFFDIVAADNCTDDSCNYIFSSDSITNSYSVAVDVAGCIIERMDCTNMSSLCDPEDLRVPLPSNDSWSDMMMTADGLGVFTFSGGRVTFDGVSYGSVATYTTTGDYRVIGEQSSICESDEWMPPEAIIRIARCEVRDLLLINMDPVCQTPMSDGTCTEWMVCFENGSLCATFSGTSVNDVAVHTTSSDYCSEPLQRTCMANEEWSSEIPDITKVCDGGLPVWNIALIVLGVICFIAGVVIAVIVVIFLLITSGATTQLWYKIMLIASAVVTVISLILWLVLIGYTASNDFCKDGGQMRGSNSRCEPPSGDSKVKDALVIASFAFSLLVVIEWIVSAALWGCGVDKNTTKAPQKPQRSKKSKEADQELAAYDNLNHGNPPSSPQPLLSDSDPAYGKLNPDEEQQYSHIQREPKKPVYDPDDPNYSHFPRKEDQHYGKLDHGVKKQSTLPTRVVPPPSDSEYGKLDRSEMDSTPHYGKLDHGVRKGTTLPGTVIPPTGDEYGKLDRTQMEIVSAEPGGMYDVVTNEPRRKPPKALPKAPLGEGLYDPTAKPRKKPGH